MDDQVTTGEGPDRAEGGVRTRPRHTDERGTREVTQQLGPAGHATTGPEPAHVRDDPIGHGAYGAGALDEVTVPPTDPVREAKDRDLHDPADVRVDPADLRDGGPTRTPGAMTT
ncbi:MAG TPA: hypothetical protein VFY17_06800, partial [Pilimelia sp.]|nr:hypothetical protein [Pilimelia sp.]